MSTRDILLGLCTLDLFAYLVSALVILSVDDRPLLWPGSCLSLSEGSGETAHYTRAISTTPFGIPAPYLRRLPSAVKRPGRPPTSDNLFPSLFVPAP